MTYKMMPKIYPWCAECGRHKDEKPGSFHYCEGCVDYATCGKCEYRNKTDIPYLAVLCDGCEPARKYLACEDIWKERNKLRKERDELRAALEWAIENGGWRLFYYSEDVPEIFDITNIVDPKLRKGGDN